MSRTVVTGKTINIDPVIRGTEGLTIPTGTTAQRPTTPTEGIIRYNTNTGKFEGYSKNPNDSANAIWTSIGGGNILDLGDVNETGLADGDVLKYESSTGTFIPAKGGFETITVSGQSNLNVPPSGEVEFVAGAGIQLTTDTSTGKLTLATTTQANLSVDTFSANGSTSEFTLTRVPPSPTDILVFVDNLYQPPSSYTIVGTAPAKLVFGDNIPNGMDVTVTYLNLDTVQATVVDGSITPAKLSQSTYYVDTFYGDATTKIYTLSQSAASANQLLVTINGIVQDPGADNAYSVTGNVLTFVNAPTFNAIIKVRFMGVTFSTTSAIAPNGVGIPQMDIGGGSGSAGQVLGLGSSGGLIWISPASADFIYNNQTFVNAKSLEFDVTEGYTLTETSPGVLKVGFTDYLKTITVSGQPVISMDDSRSLEFIEGPGIGITTGNTSGDKELTISVSLTSVAENIIPSTSGTYNIGAETLPWKTVFANTLDLGSNLITESNGVLLLPPTITLGGSNSVTLKSSANGLQVEKITLGSDAQISAGNGVTLINNGGRLDLPADSITISELAVGTGTSGQYLSNDGAGSLQWVTGLTSITAGSGLTTSSGNAIITTSDTLELDPGIVSNTQLGITAHGWGDHADAGYLTDITSQTLSQLSDVQTGVLDATREGWTIVWDDVNKTFIMKDIATKWQVGNILGSLFYSGGRVGIGTNSPDALLYINHQESEPSRPFVVQDGTNTPISVPAGGALTADQGIHLDTDIQTAPPQPTKGGLVYFKSGKPYYVSSLNTETPLGGALGDLGNVSTVGTLLSGYGLVYDADDTTWKAQPINLNTLGNVDAITGLADGKILSYDANTGEFRLGDPVTSVPELEDTNISALGDGDTLIYDSQVGKWVNTAAGTTITRFSETVNDTTKDVFNFSYAPGNVDVFLNGIKLLQDDFDSIDGSTIRLATPARQGDTVDMVNQGGKLVSANVIYFKQEYTATGSETFFDLAEPYATGYVECYLNGTKLKGSDYTATSTQAPYRVFLNNVTINNGDSFEIIATRTVTSTDSTMAIYSKSTFTAAGGETFITSPTALTAGHFEIFLNGVKLSGSDFSLNANTFKVDLNFILNIGDEIEIMAFKPRSTSIVQNFIEDQLTATGGETTMALSATPPTKESCLVIKNNVIMSVDEYTIGNNTLNFVTPLINGQKILVKHLQIANSSALVPSANSVTGSMMNATLDGDFTVVPYQYQNDDTISTASTYGAANKNTALVGPLTMSEQVTIEGIVTVI